MLPVPPGMRRAYPQVHPDVSSDVRALIRRYIDTGCVVEAINLAEDAEMSRVAMHLLDKTPVQRSPHKQ